MEKDSELVQLLTVLRDKLLEEGMEGVEHLQPDTMLRTLMSRAKRLKAVAVRAEEKAKITACRHDWVAVSAFLELRILKCSICGHEEAEWC
jgi:hypothetical protein